MIARRSGRGMLYTWPCMLIVHTLLMLLIIIKSSASESSSPSSNNDNTWALLACTSRFWYNYRHAANALSIYRLTKRLGIPDSQIILMLADDMPCNSRNALPGTVYKSIAHEWNLCGNGDMEVDYKESEVTVENFLRVLTGRHEEGWPVSKRLMTNNESRVLLYMSGHGGDQFLKFHNLEEISSDDLGGALEDMRQEGRFKEMLFIVDTCQGGTLFEKFDTPGILAMGSSGKGENSYAHQNDMTVGVALVDRFTDATCDYVHKVANRVPGGHLGKILNHLEKVPLEGVIRSYSPEQLKSTPVIERKWYNQSLASTPITRFFAQSTSISLLPDLGEVEEEEEEEGGDDGEDQCWEEGEIIWKVFRPRRRMLEDEGSRTVGTSSLEDWGSRVWSVSLALCILWLLMQGEKKERSVCLA